MWERNFLKQSFLLVWRRPFYAAVLLVTMLLSIQLIQVENNPGTVSQVPVALVDLAQDTLSEAVWNAVDEETILDIVNDINDRDLDAYLDDLLWGRIEALYVIEADFAAQLQAGNFSGCMRVYYGVNQVSARMLTETVSSSVLEICLRQRGMDLLREAYRTASETFDNTLVQEAEEYLAGLEDATYPMEFITLEGDADSGIPSFRSIVLRCFLLLILTASLLTACGFLTRQREDGIFLRLQGLGHSPGSYTCLIFALAAAGLLFINIISAVVSGFAYDSGITEIAFQIISAFLIYTWLTLILAFLLLHLRRQIYLLFVPVFILSLTLLAGVSVYLQGQGTAWTAALYLNPFAAYLILPNRPHMAACMLGHIFVLAGLYAAGRYAPRIRRLLK